MTRRQFEDDEWQWFAFAVVPQKEFLSGLLLRRLGAATFTPVETRFRKRSRYAKGKVEVAYPLIPGTLFAGFAAEPPWYELNSLPVVRGVLSIDGKPRRIDTAAQDWIRFRAAHLDGRLTIEQQLMLHRGAQVERSVQLVEIQGRGVIRSSMAPKARAAANRPIVVTAAGERAALLGALLMGGVE